MIYHHRPRHRFPSESVKITKRTTPQDIIDNKDKTTSVAGISNRIVQTSTEETSILRVDNVQDIQAKQIARVPWRSSGIEKSIQLKDEAVLETKHWRKQRKDSNITNDVFRSSEDSNILRIDKSEVINKNDTTVEAKNWRKQRSEKDKEIQRIHEIDDSTIVHVDESEDSLTVKKDVNVKDKSDVSFGTTKETIPWTQEAIKLRPTKTDKSSKPKEQLEKVHLKPVQKKQFDNVETVVIDESITSEENTIILKVVEEGERIQNIIKDGIQVKSDKLQEQEKPQQVELKPVMREKEKHVEKIQSEEVSWRTGKRVSKEEQATEEVLLKPEPRKEKSDEENPEEVILEPFHKDKVKHIEENKPEEVTWRTGKRKPKEEHVEGVSLKPIPRKEKPQEEKPEETKLKPVKKEKTIEDASPEDVKWPTGIRKPKEKQPEDEVTLKPIPKKEKSEEEKHKDTQVPTAKQKPLADSVPDAETFQKSKRKPQEERPIEEVVLKPVPRVKKSEDRVEPEKVELKPVKREKGKPVEEIQPEEVAWRTGKRKPKEEQPAEEVILKPVPRKDKPVEEKLDEVNLKPVQKGKVKPIEEAKPEEVSWRTGKKKPKEEQAVDEVILQPIPKMEKPEEDKREIGHLKPVQKDKIKPIEETKPEEVSWRTGKRKPQEGQPVEQVILKPIPKEEKPEEEKSKEMPTEKQRPLDERVPDEVTWSKGKRQSQEENSLVEVVLKPVPREKKPQDIIEPEKVELKPVKREKGKPLEEIQPEEVALRTGKRKPKEEKPAEEVILKPIPRKEKPQEEKLDEINLKPVRKDKVKPIEETKPEEVSWRTGKRKPKEEQSAEEVNLKPIPKEEKQEEEKPDDIKLKPFRKDTEKSLEEVQPEEVSWLTGKRKPKEEKPTEDVSLRPVLKVEKLEEEQSKQDLDREKPTEQKKPEEVTWRTGKKKPKEEQPVEEVALKPIPIKEKAQEKKPEEVELKPVQKQKTVEDTTPEDVKWPTGKRKPKEEQPVEEVALKPIPRKEKAQEEKPEEVKLKPVQKQKTVEDTTPEDVKWPTGKRKPKEEQPEEEVTLKPIPRKEKPQEEKPEEVKLKPVRKEKIVEDTTPEDVKWPTGKRKPKEEQPEEEIKLKPVPKKQLPEEEIPKAKVEVPAPKHKPIDESLPEDVTKLKSKKPKEKQPVEEVSLKPIIRGEKPEEEKQAEVQLKPVPKEMEMPIEELKPEQISWRTGKRKPKEEQPEEEVILKPVPKKERPEEDQSKDEELKPVLKEKEESIEEVKSQEISWRTGKRKPKDERLVEEVNLKPTPKVEKPEEETLDKVQLKPVQKDKEKPVEEIKPDEVTWRTGKRKPKEELPQEEVKLKPVPKKEKSEEEKPEEIKLKPVKKEKIIEEPSPADVKWPTGKRKPKEEQPGEEVILKPIPHKEEPKEDTPKEEIQVPSLKQKPEVKRKPKEEKPENVELKPIKHEENIVEEIKSNKIKVVEEVVVKSEEPEEKKESQEDQFTDVVDEVITHNEKVIKKKKVVKKVSLEKETELQKSSEKEIGPIIIQPLQAAVVNEHDNFELTVMFNPKTVSSITWFMNNKAIEENDDCIIHTETGKSIVKIRHADKKKIGKYEVILENNNIVAKSASTVKLNKSVGVENVNPPVFIRPLQPKFVRLGDVILLETEVTSNPCASFQWFLGNREVSTYIKQNKIRNMYVTSKDNISCLCIENITNNLEGIITCRAENFSGSVSSSASLFVVSDAVDNVLGEPPKFIDHLKPTTVMDGDPILLSCTVVGEPWPKIEWFHHEKLLEVARDVTIGRQESGLCELCIKEAFPEMTGIYKCVATNEFGQCTNDCVVNVEAYEYVPSASEEDLLSDEKTSDIEEFAPKIVKALPTVVKSNEGELTRFEAKAVGVPKPQIRWMKKGVIIKHSKQYQMEEMEDGTSVLIIPQVLQEDTGDIKFEAYNPLGVTTTVAALSVQSLIGTKEYRKPEWVTHMEELQAALQATQSVPTFVQNILSERVQEGETVTFDAIFSGNPQPEIIWYKDEKPIMTDSSFQIETKDNRTICKVKKVAKKSEGSYSCKAVSDVGMAITRATLQVFEADEKFEKIKKKRVKSLKQDTIEEAKAETLIEETSSSVIKTEVDVMEQPDHIVEAKEEKAIMSVKELDYVETVDVATSKKVETKVKKSVQRKPENIEPKITPHDYIITSEETKDESVESFEKTSYNLEKIQTKKVLSDSHLIAEVNELLEVINAKEFGPGESPLRELATIGYMLRNGVTVEEIEILYESEHFPSLRVPQSQSALVQLVERQGHGALITEVLTEETAESEDIIAAKVGFKAFMKMVEMKHTSVEEVIAHLYPEDFTPRSWEQKGAHETIETEVKEKAEMHAPEIHKDTLKISEDKISKKDNTEIEQVKRKKHTKLSKTSEVYNEGVTEIVQSSRQQRSKDVTQFEQEEETISLDDEPIPLVKSLPMDFHENLIEVIPSSEATNIIPDEINEQKAIIKLDTNQSLINEMQQSQENEKPLPIKSKSKHFIKSTFTEAEPLQVTEIDIEHSVEKYLASDVTNENVTNTYIVSSEGVETSETIVNISVGQVENCDQQEGVAKPSLLLKNAIKVTEQFAPIKESPICDSSIKESVAAVTLSPLSGLNVEEVKPNDKEEDLVTKPIEKTVTPKPNFSLLESIEVGEVFVEDKSGKYYPELIVPTEMAKEDVIVSNQISTEILNIQEKESAFDIPKAPSSQEAKLNLISKDSIVVSTNTPHEKEGNLEPFSDSSTNASVGEDIGTHFSLDNLITTSHIKESELQPTQYAEKLANVSFNEHQHTYKVEPQIHDSEYSLEKEKLANEMYAQMNVTALQKNITEEVQVHERETRFPVKEDKPSMTANIEMDVAEPVIMSETVGISPMDEFMVSEKKLDEIATESFITETAKTISTPFVHDQEIPENYSFKKPENITVSLTPNMSLTVSQTETSDSAENLGINKTPELNTALKAPTHHLKTPLSEIITTADQITLLNELEQKTDTATEQRDILKELLVTEATVSEQICQFDRIEIPKNEAITTFSEKESINISEIVPNVAEDVFKTMPSENKKAHINMDVNHKVPVVLEVSSRESANEFNLSLTLTEEALVKQNILSSVMVSESKCLDSQGILQDFTKPDEKTITSEIVPLQDIISVMETVHNEKEGTYDKSVSPKSYSASSDVFGHPVAVSSETVADSSVSLTSDIHMPKQTQANVENIPHKELCVTSTIFNEKESTLLRETPVNFTASTEISECEALLIEENKAVTEPSIFNASKILPKAIAQSDTITTEAIIQEEVLVNMHEGLLKTDNKELQATKPSVTISGLRVPEYNEKVPIEKELKLSLPQFPDEQKADILHSHHHGIITSEVLSQTDNIQEAQDFHMSLKKAVGKIDEIYRKAPEIEEVVTNQVPEEISCNDIDQQRSIMTHVAAHHLESTEVVPVESESMIPKQSISENKLTGEIMQSQAILTSSIETMENVDDYCKQITKVPTQDADVGFVPFCGTVNTEVIVSNDIEGMPKILEKTVNAIRTQDELRQYVHGFQVFEGDTESEFVPYKIPLDQEAKTALVELTAKEILEVQFIEGENAISSAISDVNVKKASVSLNQQQSLFNIEVIAHDNSEELCIAEKPKASAISSQGLQEAIEKSEQFILETEKPYRDVIPVSKETTGGIEEHKSLDVTEIIPTESEIVLNTLPSTQQTVSVAHNFVVNSGIKVNETVFNEHEEIFSTEDLKTSSADVNLRPSESIKVIEDVVAEKEERLKINKLPEAVSNAVNLSPHKHLNVEMWQLAETEAAFIEKDNAKETSGIIDIETFKSLNVSKIEPEQQREDLEIIEPSKSHSTSINVLTGDHLSVCETLPLERETNLPKTALEKSSQITATLDTSKYVTVIEVKPTEKENLFDGVFERPSQTCTSTIETTSSIEVQEVLTKESEQYMSPEDISKVVKSNLVVEPQHHVFVSDVSVKEREENLNIDTFPSCKNENIGIITAKHILTFENVPMEIESDVICKDFNKPENAHQDRVVLEGLYSEQPNILEHAQEITTEITSDVVLNVKADIDSLKAANQSTVTVQEHPEQLPNFIQTKVKATETSAPEQDVFETLLTQVMESTDKLSDQEMSIESKAQLHVETHKNIFTQEYITHDVPKDLVHQKGEELHAEKSLSELQPVQKTEVITEERTEMLSKVAAVKDGTATESHVIQQSIENVRPELFENTGDLINQYKPNLTKASLDLETHVSFSVSENSTQEIPLLLKIESDQPIKGRKVIPEMNPLEQIEVVYDEQITDVQKQIINKENIKSKTIEMLPITQLDVIVSDNVTDTDFKQSSPRDKASLSMTTVEGIHVLEVNDECSSKPIPKTDNIFVNATTTLTPLPHIQCVENIVDSQLEELVTHTSKLKTVTVTTPSITPLIVSEHECLQHESVIPSKLSPENQKAKTGVTVSQVLEVNNEFVNEQTQPYDDDKPSAHQSNLTSVEDQSIEVIQPVVHTMDKSDISSISPKTSDIEETEEIVSKFVTAPGQDEPIQIRTKRTIIRKKNRSKVSEASGGDVVIEESLDDEYPDKQREPKSYDVKIEEYVGDESYIHFDNDTSTIEMPDEFLHIPKMHTQVQIEEMMDEQIAFNIESTTNESVEPLDLLFKPVKIIPVEDEPETVELTKTKTEKGEVQNVKTKKRLVKGKDGEVQEVHEITVITSTTVEPEEVQEVPEETTVEENETPEDVFKKIETPEEIKTEEDEKPSLPQKTVTLEVTDKTKKKLKPQKIEHVSLEMSSPQKPEELEGPQFAKLKLKKPTQKPREEPKTVALPKFQLKSRIKLITDWPPNPIKPILTNIGSIKQCGDLSRNIKEAKKIKKKIIKEELLPDLEKTELEQLEKIEFDRAKDITDTVEVLPNQQSKEPLKEETVTNEIPASKKKNKLVPIKIEQKVLQIDKPQHAENTEGPQFTKIKLKKTITQEKQDRAIAKIPKLQLKSRIKFINDWPPEILKPSVSIIDSIRQSGILSRNVKEAAKIKKKPIKQVVLPEVEKIELEKPMFTHEDIIESKIQLPEDDKSINENITSDEKDEEPEQFTILPRKPSLKKVEEIEDEVVIKKKLKPTRKSSVTLPEITEPEIVVFRPKSTKTLEDVEQEFNIQLNSYAEEEISMSSKVKLKPQKQPTFGEEANETSIKFYEDDQSVEEIIISDTESDVDKESANVVLSMKKSKVMQKTHEEDMSVTLAKPKKPIETSEIMEDVNITLDKKHEYVIDNQEEIAFDIKQQIEQRKQEDLTLSSKIKIKPKKKVSKTEAADEVSIKVEKYIEDTEQVEEVIISEDESEGNVEMVLKRKQKKTPYEVNEVEELNVALKPKRVNKAPTFEEEEITISAKRKPKKPLTIQEADVTMSIAREQEFPETPVNVRSGDIVFAVYSYVAETDEAISLVEGERLYILDTTNQDWWYVRKHLTEEKGWVPAQYLMDEENYTLYLQKKLNEKIDKLPVFEKPTSEEQAIAPIFVEKLRPKHTPDGSTVQFECQVEGYPRPQITWFRQTAIIKPSQDFQMYYDDDNVSTLVIREVFPEDAGTFTCVAKNAAGFASSTTELIVEAPLSDHGSEMTILSRKSLSRESSLADILEGIPPTFSKRPKAQYVDEGSDIYLECRLVAIPEPDITWLFKGDEIMPNENISIVTESDMHMYCSVLKISHVKKCQEGTYTVLAMNREGEASLPIVLKIKTGEKEKPQVIEPLKNISIREGESFVLTTQVVGNPEPKVTWFRNNKLLKSVPVKSDGNVHSITIIKPKKGKDDGVYTLKAINSEGETETSAVIVIEEPTEENAEPPLFIHRFQEITVKEKETIKLTAKVTGNPVPSITWYRNNKIITPSETITQRFDGENIELIITNVDSEVDSGDYKCVASNSAGKASHGAKVTIDVEKVTFVKKLEKTYEIEEGKTVILECKTSHTVSTKWYHNNKELSGMDHREIIQEGRLHKLRIKKAKLSDKGTLKCVVKDQETSTSLTVHETIPEFLRRLQDFEVKEKDIAILEVEINSETADVIWEKDGEEIKSKKNKYELEKRGNVRKLFIRNTSVHDEGEYVCKLRDDLCTAEITVVELPPEIISRLQDQRVNKGHKATFEIELTKGDALVRWLKDGSEIQFSNHMQLTIDGKKQKLKIYDCDLSDAGEYACEVGSERCVAKLVVDEPSIDFTIRLPETVVIPLAADAYLTVEVPDEKYDVVWYKRKTVLEDTDKFTLIRDGKKRTLIIRNCIEEDQSEYSCVLFDARCSTKLKVEVIEFPPKVIAYEKEYKVKRGGDVTINVQYEANPPPNDEWIVNAKIIKRSKHTKPSIDSQNASLTIRKIEHSDAGIYKLKLENNCGVVEIEIKVIVMDIPSPPGAPKVLDVDNTFVNIYWSEPTDTGYSQIECYVVEYQEINTTEWISIESIRKNQYCVENLKTKSSYRFRVFAVNEVGISESSEVTEFIRIEKASVGQAPSVEKPLKDIIVNPDESVELSCIFGGVPEPKVIWVKNGKQLKTAKATYVNRVATLVITASKTSEGEYKCIATNEFGDVETSCNLEIQLKPIITVADSEIDQKNKIDKEWSVTANIEGIPRPNVIWYRNGTRLETTEEIEIITTEITSIIRISKLKRSHSGKYTIEASNKAGTSALDLSLKVFDKPSKPKGPVVLREISRESVTIEWKPPVDDGGIELTKYAIEKHDPEVNQWVRVADVNKDVETYCIQRLNENCEYMFRVMAQNPVGVSEALESEPIVIKTALDVPSPPLGPLGIYGIDNKSVTITWNPSEKNGGSAILDYSVEIKQDSKQWIHVATVPETLAEIDKLSLNSTYQFRICARNEIGTSLPYVSDEKITIGKTLSPPSRPQRFIVREITSRSVTLQWAAPDSDGGSPVTNYIIEYKTVKGKSWSKVITVGGSVFEHCIENLKDKEQIVFRISAENAIGVSLPTQSQHVRLDKHATVPSPPTAPLEMRMVGNNMVMTCWGTPEWDGGAPLLGYNIAIRDVTKTMWIEVGKVDANNLQFNVRDLNENHTYMVRIYARNEIGLSEPLESDEPFKVLPGEDSHFDEEPGEMTEATEPTSFSQTTTSWLREHNMDADIRSYARGSLLRRDEYFFRIWYYAKQLFK
ncbi:titin-like [Colias croceus]|uniref:titin-like n=1 Tax=Colias crocea TaxID=72248 RepID=UPI001E27B07A|nr:titin-like [Colias croceus]